MTELAVIEESSAPAPVPDAPPATEAPPEVTPEPEAPAVEEPRVAAKFAELARREAAAVKRERELKAQEVEFKKWKETTSAAKANPLAYLQAAGLTIKEAVDHYLNEGKEPTAEERIAALEKERADAIAAREAEAKAMSARQAQETVANFQNSVTEKVKADERFELVNAQEEWALVHEIIEAHFVATAQAADRGERDAPELLSWDKAAELAENHLLAKAKKALTAKKLAAVAIPAPAAADAKAGDKPATPTKEKSIADVVRERKSAGSAATVSRKGITNSTSTAPATSSDSPPANETKRERIARILAKQKATGA